MAMVVRKRRRVKEVVFDRPSC
ncbi:hypothetical protein CCACVL1_03124 [Corchorus capsularis]|uniref:Uncharacterized protein n=1 Tax=Corchorus capsularis TaxID=210143 RepID=A0A1R3K2H7_COCAP|nr:hypothetical protein CCACVL1_03124 [Corchorus capsularis]